MASYWCESDPLSTSISLCVWGGHNSTLYLNADLDVSDLQVATPHNLELLEGNSQIAD